MSLETAMRAVRFITDNADAVGSIPQINFFGGEPLLRWNEVVAPVITHLREIYQKPCDIGITTNCILLDEEKLRFLSQNNVGILASIDGGEQSHNLNRQYADGRGSFEDVSANVPLLLRYYPDISARMTLTPETVGTLLADYTSLRAMEFQRVECAPNVFVTWGEEDVDQLRSQMRLISDRYIEEFSPETPRNGFHSFERGFQDVKRVNYAFEHHEHRTFRCARCGIGIDAQVAINHLGDIYPCHEANCDQSLYIGNINSGMDNDKRVSLAKTYATEKVRGLNCDTCRYDNVCNGGCAIFNYMLSKDFNQVPQMECRWKQILLDECEYILERMARHNNTAFRDYFGSLSQW